MKKKLLAISLSAAMLFSMSGVVYAADAAGDIGDGANSNSVSTQTVDDDQQIFTAASSTTYTSGDWNYALSYSSSKGTTATIKSYNGSAASVVIPDSLDGYTVTGIGYMAFAGNTMTSLTIPESITTIENCAFKNCRKLTRITINAENLEDCSMYSLNSVFYNAGADSGGVAVIFGDTVKTIPDCLFAVSADESEGVYARITSVVIPDSVETIGDFAFAFCYDLQSVSWGSGIQSIGVGAFEDSAITQVVIPEGTTAIGYDAFKNCRKLNRITINAKSLADMGGGDFFYNAGADSSSLSVIFGDTVRTIPEYLFFTDESYDYGDGAYAHITSVTIPVSVNQIGKKAFYNCFDLLKVDYTGSASTWSMIDMGDGNDSLDIVSFHGHSDTLAVRRGNIYYFNYQIKAGDADAVIAYGKSADTVLIGDWDGDGIDTICVRRGNVYYFKNSISGGNADQVIAYGKATDEILVGDWDGDGKDTLAVRRGNACYIKNSIASGDADKVIAYGKSSDIILVGDWDGDGKDTLAARRGNIYYIKNSISNGNADAVIAYGKSADTVLIGDWDGDGKDTLTVRRENVYYIKNSISNGNADRVIAYGKADDKVYVGSWQ